MGKEGDRKYSKVGILVAQWDAWAAVGDKNELQPKTSILSYPRTIPITPPRPSKVLVRQPSYLELKEYWTHQKSIEPLIDSFELLQEQVPGVSSRNAARLQIDNAYSDALMSAWSDLTELGIYYTARAKPLNLQNSRRGSPKTIDDKAKTEAQIIPEIGSVGSACWGHLRIKDENLRVVESYTTPVEFSKVKYKYNGEEVTAFATHEWQTINSVRGYLDSGRYTLEEQSTDSSAPYIIIRDSIGEYYFISLADKNLREDSSTDITDFISRSKIFESNSSQIDAIISKLKINVGKEARLLRFDRISRDIDTRPNILCDANGTPIVGDIDLQTTKLRDDLPVGSFKIMTATTQDRLIEDLQELVKQLRAVHLTRVADRISAGIKNLRAMDQKQGDKRVELLGVISLFNAGIALSIPSGDIQHGDEGLSPLFPENITVSNILDPKHKDKFIITHSEYECVSTYILYEPLLDRKVMTFNPCWLVSGNHTVTNAKTGEIEERNWRVNVSDTDMKSKHRFAGEHSCRNLEDEAANIKLWRLLFEKQLLQYRFNHTSEEYAAYVSVVKDNFAMMIKASLMKNPELARVQRKGSNVALKIIQRCDSINEDNIEQRIADIVAEAKDIAQPSFRINRKKSIRGV